MIGTAVDPDDATRTIKYTYDTMHEGFTKLRQNYKRLLNDYEECIKFVYRDICSADAFYQGILGLSVRRTKIDEDGNTVLDQTGKPIIEYVVNTGDYKSDVLEQEYFGISTYDWDHPDELINNLKHQTGNSKSGSMRSVGECSSIREHLPLTAFIKERKDAVRKYAISVGQRTQGVGFSNARRDKPV